ncbi:MAG: CofH family radical SAM protein, partial [Bacteroidetes bacterium]|nr:CofH family radical SAM protein [Bacteroidota bacterium]
PSNICRFHCRFCSFRKSSEKGYLLSVDEVLDKIKSLYTGVETEVHITGSVHPKHNFNYMLELVSAISKAFPNIHIKAFSAVELAYIMNAEGIPFAEGLSKLKQAGLGSLPGGGAEIFDESIRKQICPDKPDGASWLAIHEAAHKTGIPSNATMLYGHIEKFEHRIDHLEKLRYLQDNTKGFNAFIPLKFLSANNEMSSAGEGFITDDMRNYAISRIFLDNIPHLKAYWPAIGRDAAQMSLMFGVDDLDGTINNTTSIYTEAGSREQRPDMSEEELKRMIRTAGFEAKERDSLYRTR